MGKWYMGYDYDADGVSFKVGQFVNVLQSEAGGWALVKTADGEPNASLHPQDPHLCVPRALAAPHPRDDAALLLFRLPTVPAPTHPKNCAPRDASESIALTVLRPANQTVFSRPARLGRHRGDGMGPHGFHQGRGR